MEKPGPWWCHYESEQPLRINHSFWGSQGRSLGYLRFGAQGSLPICPLSPGLYKTVTERLHAYKTENSIDCVQFKSMSCSQKPIQPHLINIKFTLPTRMTISMQLIRETISIQLT